MRTEYNVDAPFLRYASLDEYLTCFKYTVAVMQDGEALSRVAYEFATDNYTEGRPPLRRLSVCCAPARMRVDLVVLAQ
jgi:hypothetical protein